VEVVKQHPCRALGAPPAGKSGRIRPVWANGAPLWRTWVAALVRRAGPAHQVAACFQRQRDRAARASTHSAAAAAAGSLTGRATGAVIAAGAACGGEGRSAGSGASATGGGTTSSASPLAVAGAASDVQVRCHAAATESLTNGQCAGMRVDSWYVNGPSSSSRKTSSSFARDAVDRLRPWAVRGARGAARGVESESGNVLADVWAPKRTPENLPLQEQQYLARSLLAVWQSLQYFVMRRGRRRSSCLPCLVRAQPRMSEEGGCRCRVRQRKNSLPSA